MILIRRATVIIAVLATAGLPARLVAAEPNFALSIAPRATLKLQGVIGERVERNTQQWLLRAPASNPGLLAMFEMRDRRPTPELVPWAGEFVGKYLTSGALALRLDNDPRLEAMLRDVTQRLYASQAENGYLGPFTRDRQLLENWDLWGHYHIMLGLMLWNEATNDPQAIAACRSMADLMCRIYLDGSRRVIDAKSPEMNLSILHGLALLYQRTGEQRYLELAKAVVQDFERAGDYLRTGLSDIEFYQTPSPRWESLHCLQGLVEMYRVTGDAAYRDAFLRHWKSILRYDRRNTGGFSSGEQATGDPFADTPIETCCSVAWSAISLDALTLTGDSKVADELELSLFNALAGAQHPSGCWWTYDTPMNGRRAASAHAIVFQARPGTPELNCCSVNGPRGLAMVSQWGLMRSDAGIAVNFYGPMTGTIPLADGAEFSLRQSTNYPRDGEISVEVLTAPSREVDLRLRVPAWAKGATVALNGGGAAPAEVGTYYSMRRRWTAGDRIQLHFDFSLRSVPGAQAQTGRVSLYRGPILLAFDQATNRFDDHELPLVDVSLLDEARVTVVESHASDSSVGRFQPWLFVDVATVGGGPLRLCDFATAGSRGGWYRSWLKAHGAARPLPSLRLPRDRAAVSPGAIAFAWANAADCATAESLLVTADVDFKRVLLRRSVAGSDQIVIKPDATAAWPTGKPLYWKLIAADSDTVVEFGPPRRFTVDVQRRVASIADAMAAFPRADGLVLHSPLAGDITPRHGMAGESTTWTATSGRSGNESLAIALDGKSSLIRYSIPTFPQQDYTASIWIKLHGRQDSLGQVLSAWCAPGDDPLRICVQGQKLFARIEGGQGAGTDGVAIASEQWFHAAAVKRGGELRLYVDGSERSRAPAPRELRSAAEEIGVGGNPRYTGGPEFLAADVCDLRVWNRALGEDEIRELAEQAP